ncbi:GRP family sugar transporter [uncultured Lactobacillus sp.]|uniref:GRP family sugar transporter n=1 Tax=uncultured Lactobacillus sp. TaxID=153152 RepID=UPI0026168A79|nr:GRP family sugar transporter [uncultured Lactobacillus sp.]
MKYLYLFIPALGWGLMPLVIASVKKSTVYNQIVGTVAASFVFGALVMLILHPAISWSLFLISALGGALWVVGQVGQYISYARIGVSETMPISTGLQLIGVPLVGVVAFGEWGSSQAKIWGFLGILVLIFGVVLTSMTDKGTAEGSKQNQVSTIILLVLTTLGYVASSSIPKALTGSGVSIFFGQTAGMVVAVFIYTLATGNIAAWGQKATFQSGVAGILYSVAALAYILSVQANGVNMAFVISQLCVVISTLGGLIFLHEKKTQKGLVFTLLGLVLIIAGAVMTTLF